MSRPSSSLSGGMGVPGRTGDMVGSVRCAIYTRKSSEEGLDMLFNSLDAQREAGMDYIKSQRSQGWVAVPTLYDDGGFSGGNTERPGLQRLLADIKAQRIDIVVVYKVDRLSRSLSDFARLMQVFDEHRVSFVSVTQQFNTTTSMGRLTLNMLLSFAQFEREVTGERIRDKIAATMRRGIFTVGRPPFGYRRPVPSDPDPGNRVIRIVPEEADIVRRVYALYLEHRSPLAVIEALRAEGIHRRLRQCDTGLNVGKLVWSTGHIHSMLTNATYAGKIVHTRGANLPEGKGRCPTDIWPGLHEPIIDPELWDRVQALINRRERAPATRWSHTHLLKGKLRTNEGSTMTPSNSMKRLADGGCRRVPYYVSMKACTQGRGSCPVRRVNAGVLDTLVRALVLDRLESAHGVHLGHVELEVRDLWIREVIEGVVVGIDCLRVTLNVRRIRACRESLGDGSRSSSTPTPTPVPRCRYVPEVTQEPTGVQLSEVERETLALQIQIKRHDGRHVLLHPEGQDLICKLDSRGRPEPSPHIVRAIGQAYAMHGEVLRTGKPMEEVARALGMDPARGRQLHVLTHLSPTILRAALTGTLSPQVSLLDLRAAASELDWTLQASRLGMR
ncbi:MAG: recombinase family protein [Phycisphaeraceae bacterium]|nr:MAG: recombinase family protein [Phycisphaeraceae bacterium]